MTDHAPAPIVAGVDGSAASLDAVRWAARIAARDHAPLHLIHALDFSAMLAGGVVPPPEELKDILRTRGKRYLRVAGELANAQGAGDVTTRLDPDRATQALLEASRTARLVVVGASGHGRLTTALAGSVASALGTHAHCDTVIVRGNTWDEPDASARPVVTGIDGGTTTPQVLTAAFAEAQARRAPLAAVHAWADDPPRPEAEPHMDFQSLNDAGRRLLTEFVDKYATDGVEVEQVVVRDHPSRDLLERSEDAQLVVVGSRGRGGFPGLLLGSTGQALLHNAACPVLIVRTGSSH